MDHTEIYIQIQELFHKYNIGTLIEEPKRVTGGLMHKVYFVTTGYNRYAVKRFNSSVMKREGVIDNIINSERIAAALKEIVPVVPAISFNGESLLFLNDQHYMIFAWVDGESIFPPHITVENCTQIGTMLGKIHSANIVIPRLSKKTDEPKLYNWDNYLRLGQTIHAVWVDELTESINHLKKWNKEMKESYASLSNNQVLSHGDLDPKNVLWYNNNPFIIDWEAAGYVNPQQELLEVINYWANNDKGELDRVKFNSIYQAYRETAVTNQVNWDIVLASGFGGMLGWLDYNFKRSLGIDTESIEEKKMGTEQAIGTMKELWNYSQNTKLLTGWL